MQSVLWSRVDGNGMEYCEVNTKPFTTLRGQVVAQLNGNPISVFYSVECEDNGATHFVELTLRSNGQQNNLSLIRTMKDGWLCNGYELEDFRGVKDIELGITPSTNMLPINRFHLSPGDSVNFTAVWIRFPDLTLAPLEQKYTCINSKTYLYQSIGSGYEAKIDVDHDGIVINYEHEWKRV